MFVSNSELAVSKNADVALIINVGLGCWHELMTS